MTQNSTQPMKAYCGAKNRQGSACRRWPLAGKSRCRLHGGRSPIVHGFRSWAWKRFRIARKEMLSAEWPGARIRVYSETEKAYLVQLRQRNRHGFSSEFQQAVASSDAA